MRCARRGGSASAKLPAALESPASARCSSRPSSWSRRPSATIFPSPTFFTTAIATCRCPTSLPRCGRDKKVRFFSGRLLLSGYGFVLRLRHKTDEAFFAHASVVIAAVQVFFLLLLNFAARPFAVMQGTLARRRQWPESASAIHRDGDPSAPALSRLRRIYRALRVCPQRAGDEISRRQMDPHHPPLDHGDLGIPDPRHSTRRALGLLRARMGRLLGLGSSRERLAAALAHRHRIPALGHDAGKTRHVESLEHVAGVRHLLAFDSRDISHPQRRAEFGSRLRAIPDWRIGSSGFSSNFRGFRRILFQEQIVSRQRTQSGVAGLARVELPL